MSELCQSRDTGEESNKCATWGGVWWKPLLRVSGITNSSTAEAATWAAKSHHMLCFHFLTPPIPLPASFEGIIMTAIKEVDSGKEGGWSFMLGV